METVLIKREIPITKYRAMTEDELKSYVSIYSGRIVKIEILDDKAILHIVAPSTWNTILIQSILLPYRYC